MDHNIFDLMFSGMAGIDMYRGWVESPKDNPRPARLENWNPEDLAAYCGGVFVK